MNVLLPAPSHTLTSEDRDLFARVRRELLRAGRPLHCHQLAKRLGRPCTRRFREDVAYLWLHGKVRLAPGGFVLNAPAETPAPVRARQDPISCR
jgi:hypothetical protein